MRKNPLCAQSAPVYERASPIAAAVSQCAYILYSLKKLMNIPWRFAVRAAFKHCGNRCGFAVMRWFCCVKNISPQTLRRRMRLTKVWRILPF